MKFIFNLSNIPKSTLLIGIILFIQAISVTNSGFTLGVALSSFSISSKVYQETLPLLNLINSMLWDNWKVVEDLSHKLLANETDVGLVFYITELQFELNQTTLYMPMDPQIKELIDKYPSLYTDCLDKKDISPQFDDNLYKLDALLLSYMKRLYSDLKGAMNDRQKWADITFSVNIAAIVLVVLLRVLQLYFFPRMYTGRLAFIAGTGSLFAISILESTSFIIIAYHMSNNVRTIIQDDFQLYHAASRVRYFDPILTSYAQRFTLSKGNTTWKYAYDSILPNLNGSMSTSRSLLQSPYDANLYQLIDSANADLVKIETKTFQDYTNGIQLTQNVYRTNKDIYLYGVESFLYEQHNRLTASLKASVSLCQALIFFAGFLTGLGLLIFLSDLSRLYHKERTLTTSASNPLTSFNEHNSGTMSKDTSHGDFSLQRENATVEMTEDEIIELFSRRKLE